MFFFGIYYKKNVFFRGFVRFLHIIFHSKNFRELVKESCNLTQA